MSAKSNRIFYSLLIAAAIVLPFVMISSGFFASASEKVLPGVEVMGTDLGGLNREEGMASLAELEKNLRGTRVILRHHGQTWPLLLSEVGFGINEEAVMEAALNAGRQGSLIHRWQERKLREKEKYSLKPVIGFDRAALSQRVRELARDIIVEPQDAFFEIEEDETVIVMPAQTGLDIDLEKLQGDICRVLLENKKSEVNLSLVKAPPARSTVDVEVMGVDALLAGYTTSFDTSKVSRTYNVNVAARAFDNLLVRPGHMVSFNEVVGPRSSEAGYKTAPVIINDEFVDGLGGGVCQVSTTLYNCILLANLEVVERTSHALPVGYVPLGRDATVVYDALDLKFLNNTDSYLYIRSTVNGGQLTIKIYGNSAFKRDVSVNTWVTRESEPKVVYEEDPNLPEGEQVVKQEGAKGYVVAAERVVRLNGEVEKREDLTMSNYNPLKRIIAVGTIKEAQQIAPSTPTKPFEDTKPQQPHNIAQQQPLNPFGSGQDVHSIVGDGFESN